MDIHSGDGIGTADSQEQRTVAATATDADTRRRLINLAYRLLGSLADAEDVVQDTYARWFALAPQQRDAIQVPAAWLTTVATRVSLNVLTSARVRRETYVGEWIPEPVPESAEWTQVRLDDISVDPADRISLDESINMAFLVVLESMTPAERVAFILHDVFCYSFAEVAEMVGRTPAACRQLASSARRRVRDARVPAAPTAQQAGVISRFKQALEVGDVPGLVGLLAPGVSVSSDGGGRVSALLRPMQGVEQALDSFLRLRTAFADLTYLERTVNGQPGLIAQRDGVTVSVYAFEVVADRIERIWAVRNPDKLRPWTGGRGATPTVPETGR